MLSDGLLKTWQLPWPCLAMQGVHNVWSQAAEHPIWAHGPATELAITSGVWLVVTYDLSAQLLNK